MVLKRSTRLRKQVNRGDLATDNQVDDVIRNGVTFEEVFGPYAGGADETSEASDYMDKRRKLSATKHSRSSKRRSSRRLTSRKSSMAKTQPAEPMSDVEYDTVSETGTGLSWLKSGTSPKSRLENAVDYPASPSSTVVQHDTSTPSILQIHVYPGANEGVSTINLDFASLLNTHLAGLPSPVDSDRAHSSPVNEAATPVKGNSISPSLRLQRLKRLMAWKASWQKPKLGFLDIPYEIRLRIYRFLFVSQGAIMFHDRTDFRRSGGLLRTCKTVQQEAPAILYGENTFHFERTHAARGRFFEEEWRQIGFKDVRRFLETMGTKNLSMMRFISFDFSDASKGFYTNDESDRRFVHDPVVWHCLELIGNNTHLSRFTFTFAGRRHVTHDDVPFLRALTSIKAQEVTNLATFNYLFRCKRELVADLKKIMEVPRDDPKVVDAKKKKEPKVAMSHKVGSQLYGHRDRC